VEAHRVFRCHKIQSPLGRALQFERFGQLRVGAERRHATGGIRTATDGTHDECFQVPLIVPGLQGAQSQRWIGCSSLQYPVRV